MARPDRSGHPRASIGEAPAVTAVALTRTARRPRDRESLSVSLFDCSPGASGIRMGSARASQSGR